MTEPQHHKELYTSLENLTIHQNELIRISEDVESSILNSLNGQPSSFKMLKSFLGIPTGKEVGDYLAIDFGGTKLRILLVRLLGNSNYQILKTKTAILKSDEYNYISDKASAESLFDFISTLIQSISINCQKIKLGFTFSYPSKQEALNSASLMEWTKEIQTSGVVGNDVNLLLQEALLRRGLNHINPVAVINDTVGTMLTAAYQDRNTSIGSICGTGHNTCYLEQGVLPAMIINLEAGNYTNIPFSYYDDLLDKSSDKPGQQRLEKLVSGRYIGELFRLTCKDLNEKGILFKNHSIPILEMKDTFNAQHLAGILSDISPGRSNLKQWLEALTSYPISMDDLDIVNKIAETIVHRSANLVAATFLGILKHIDPNLTRHHSIALDGSLFEKMPGYSQTVRNSFDKFLHDPSKSKIKLVLTKEGSGVGAAIAAALASQTIRQT